MPSINLIAAQREEKRRIEQNTRNLFYGIACELGVAIIVASAMAVKLVSLNGHVAELAGQIGQLQPKVNRIQELQVETAQLAPQVAILNEARNNTLYWYTALQTVISSLPKEAWMTSINTTGDPAPPKAAAGGSNAKSAPPPTSGAGLSFSGIAQNSEDVGMAMLAMNQCPNISSVSVGGVSQTLFLNQNAMSFSMTVQLKPNFAQDATTPGFELPPPSASTANPAAPATTKQASAVMSVQGASHV